MEVAWPPKEQFIQVLNNGVLIPGSTRSANASGVRGCYPTLTDEALISLVGAGDALAFTVLHERYSRAIYLLACKVTRNEQDAEDLYQDAFLKVWSSAESYRAERGDVRKWIFTLARNRNIDLLRSQAAHRRALAKAGAEAQRSQPSESFELYWREFQGEQVREALRELPHTQRMVLTLSHFCELTHAQISEVLCVPLGTVKGRMRLGLEKLRNQAELREKTLW